jgi:hypothetical protein
MGGGKEKRKNLPRLDIPSKPNMDSIVVKQIDSSEKLLFSFSLLECDNDYYNFNGMCDKGFKNCVLKLSEYSKMNTSELLNKGARGTIRLHLIRKEDVDDWPTYFRDNEQVEDSFYQISFGASKGRAHGLLIDNVFYIIWFDPHHYLYHNSRFGPKVKLHNVGDCCSIREEIIEQQSNEINSLKKQIAEYKSLLDEETTPAD